MFSRANVSLYDRWMGFSLFFTQLTCLTCIRAMQIKDETTLRDRWVHSNLVFIVLKLETHLISQTHLAKLISWPVVDLAVASNPYVWLHPITSKKKEIAIPKMSNSRLGSDITRWFVSRCLWSRVRTTSWEVSQLFAVAVLLLSWCMMTVW